MKNRNFKKTICLASLILLGYDSCQAIQLNTDQQSKLLIKNDDDDDFNVDENAAADYGSSAFLVAASQVDANQQDKIDKEETKQKKQEQPQVKPLQSGSYNPNKLKSLAQTAAEGIALKNINDQQYVGEIALGSPPQVLTVMFDTGSSIMYALTSHCSKGCPKRLEKFDPTDSGTYSETDKRQDQNYGQGFVTGVLAQDNICFTQKTDDCPQINFLSVDGGNDLVKDQFSGIIGLAPASTEEKSLVPPFIDQMKQTFAFYFSKGSGSIGNLKFGDFDLEKYAKPGSKESDIVWTSLVEDNEGWTIPLNSIKFKNGNQIEIKSQQLTLDTGLSYALVPPDDIVDISMALQESTKIKCRKGGYSDLDMFECECTEEQFKKVPPLQLNINGKFFSLPAAAWMTYDNSKDNKKCQILMHPYDISMTAKRKWVVGLQFLQNFYSIFDQEKKRIGLIEAKE